MKFLDARGCDAVTIDPDFGCVEWPGGIGLCPDTMHQAMAGFAPGVSPHAVPALRDEPNKNQ